MPFKSAKLINFSFNKELTKLYASVILRALGYSFVNIFIPIFFLKLNFSLQEIVLFFLLTNIVFVLFLIPGSKIISKIGIRHSIALSVVFLLAAVGMLFFLNSNKELFYIIAILQGINWVLFWIPLQFDLAQSTDQKHRGEEVGIAKLFASIVQILGPIIGATIITMQSFEALFIVVGTIFFASVLPLIFGKEIHTQFKFSLKKILSIGHRKSLLAFIGLGGESEGSQTVFWPIFLFGILTTYQGLGSLASFTALISLASMYYISSKIDKFDKIQILKTGAIFSSATWFFRGLATTPFFVAIADTLSKILSSLTSVTLESIGLDKANKEDAAEFTIVREFGIHFGAVIFLTIAYFLNNVFLSLVLGGFFVLLYTQLE
ncbi:MAG: MFS transporter [Candidatus Diapherotrites archaeon]|nr:MFS transporter [Candidatus Diapherotrites archaeon]